MSKLKREDIVAILKSEGWQLVSDTYTNLETEMEYICPEGHHVYSPWKKMRAVRECPMCKTNSLANLDGKVLTKPAGTYRILALDQATHTTGYAVFDNNCLVKYGTFVTDSSDEIERCSTIKSWLLSMIKSWKPDYIALEGIQYQDEGNGQKMGITVFQTLARLQGILMEACYTAKIPYQICPTNTWRHSCGVKGKTRVDRKRSMQLLVKKWYDITVTDDESDAIGIGRYISGVIAANAEMENWE